LLCRLPVLHLILIHLFVLLPSFYPSLFMLCFTFISSSLFRIPPPHYYSPSRLSSSGTWRRIGW
jgi:hypothetical protein